MITVKKYCDQVMNSFQKLIKQIIIRYHDLQVMNFVKTQEETLISQQHVCFCYPFATGSSNLKLRERPQNCREDNQVYVKRLDELFLVGRGHLKG